MTEQDYKQTLNLIENSVFANMPLQWVETFQPGIGQMIANIEREVTEWADLNKPIWDSDPAQSGTYNAVKSELLAFAQNLQKYKDDPARSEVIYDFINAARSLYSFNKNYGLDRTPLTNAENPFKLSIVSSRVAAFGYMHFKNLANLVKFNEDLLASIDSEKIQLKDHTKTVLEPVREKLYKLITEDPEFKTLLEELGYGEADDFIQSFAPGNGVLESLTDEFFSNFNTFVGNISARLDAERQTTDLAIAEARADAQESIDDALERVDQLVAELSTYQTGINTQIQTIESAYESLNTTVQSNVSRIGATESAIIQEATTRADGFTATAARIDGMVSRINTVDASILQESNTRASEDAATADRIDQLVTRVDNNAAAIINEQDARTTALLVEATARQTLAAQLKSDSELYASGLVTTESNVRAAQDQVLGERIDLVSAEVGGISTAILNEQTARITGDEVEATSRKALSTKLFGTDVIDGVTVDTLTSGFLYDQQQSIITQTESVVTAATGQIAQIQTDLTNTKADLLTETTTRVNEYDAISTSVTALSTQVNNQKATLDSLNTVINGTDGITTQWGIKSDINGYITGVGLISSSKYGTPTSQFIVYADQFALVTPGVNGGQPTLPFFVGSEQGYLELSNTVKSNWNNVIGAGKPENGATVGADSSNLRAGPGVNMVFNGDYTDGLAGTTVGWRNGGNQHTLFRNLSGYIVQGEGTAVIYQPGWNGTSVFDANIWNGQEGQFFAVTPGQRYEVYAYLNTRRCVGRVIVFFHDAAGNQITDALGNEVSYAGTINTISDMRLSHCFVVAPWNAAKAYVIVRGYGINSNEPYVFFSRVYFGMAHAGQTEASPWSPGRGISQITPSNVTTYIANAAIGAAQIGSIELVGESAFKVRTNNTLGARMDMDSRRIKIFDASGTLRVQLGDLTL